MMKEIQAEHWASTTFGQTELGDRRRTKRLIQFATSLAQNVGKSVVKSTQTSAQTEAAYRFIRNDSIDPQAIAEGGFADCAEKAKAYDYLLALEDTTSLNFKHASISDQLGPLGAKASFSGIHAHSILLFSPQESHIVGLAEQRLWCRSVEEHGKNHQRNSRAYKDKESFKWEQASTALAARFGKAMDKLICVCDREADVFDYMLYKKENNQRFVVRAIQNRRIEESESRLFTYADSLKPAGTRVVEIQQRGGRKGRKVTLEVSFTKVTINPPHRHKGEPIELHYVCCKSADKQSKLCWHLLTTEPVNTVADAHRIIGFYEARWIIEDYHKAWKTGGTEVEELRMQSFGNLERMVRILAFLAVRVLQLRYIGLQGQQAPHKSCEEVLSTIEWKLLWLKTEKGKAIPEAAPSLVWAYLHLAKLVNWQDSKQTGRVGWTTLWEGWFKLQNMVEGYEIAKSLDANM